MIDILVFDFIDGELKGFSKPMVVCLHEGRFRVINLP